jgi:hypothetical protein
LCVGGGVLPDCMAGASRSAQPATEAASVRGSRMVFVFVVGYVFSFADAPSMCRFCLVLRTSSSQLYERH